MQEDSDYESVEVELPEEDLEASEPEEQESEPEESSERKKPKSGYVDLSDLPEEKRKPIESRLGELTRERAKEALKARQLEAEIRELRAKVDKVEPPKVVSMPDAELAIENPAEFNRQNQAYNDSLIKQREYESQKQAQEEQLKSVHIQQKQQSQQTYLQKVDELGIDKKLLHEASTNLYEAGVGQALEDFFLADPQGPALVAEIGTNFEELYKLSQMTPVQQASYIERYVRPRIAPVKKQSAPPPPKQVSGSRGVGKSVSDKHGFIVE